MAQDEMTSAIPNAARIRELEEALERLRPILQNAKDGFDNPPRFNDESLNAYKREGLSSGCRVGLEVIEAVLSGADRTPAAALAREWPTAGQLLEAIECLLHWRRLSINENQGGAWFYDAQGMGTKPLDPFDIVGIFKEEAKARGYELV